MSYTHYNYIDNDKPFVTWSVFFICSLFYILSLTDDTVIMSFGVQSNIPAIMDNPVSVISSMFVHAGFFHLLFNMIALWSFGPHIEKAAGTFNTLILYMASGIIAAITHAVYMNSDIPMVGASGAISGILAAYMVLYPDDDYNGTIFFIPVKSTIKKVMMGFLYINIGFILIEIMADIHLPVAWAAHVGGFASGYIIMKIYESRNMWCECGDDEPKENEEITE